MADGALERFGADTAVGDHRRRRARTAAARRSRWATSAGRVKLADGARARARRAPSRRPRRGPRPLDDRRHAPAAAAPAWRGPPGLSGARGAAPARRGRGCSSRSTCPPQTRDALAVWRDEPLVRRDDLRPVAAESLHVTLAFLGYRPEKEIETIGEAARQALAGSPACRLRTGRDRADPAAPAAAVRARSGGSEGSAVAVQAKLSDALAAGGFYKPEKRPFWPHVTIARVKTEPPSRPGRGRRGAVRGVRGRRGGALPLDPAAAGRPLRAADADEPRPGLVTLN